MELSQLPSEMVAAIADHLDARDTTACSGVSRAWRCAFNLDRIWRNYCSFGPENYLDETNKVKPAFEIPYVQGTDLDPLCEWRVNFLKELYITRNWQKGRFIAGEAEIQANACLYIMDGVDACGNHWMFLCCSSREGLKLEIWSLKNIPFLQTSMKMYNVFKNIDEALQKECVNFKLHLSGQKLLFIYDNLISVYDFSPPHYRINFLYTFSVVHTHPFFTPRNLPHLPSGSKCEIEVLGNLLFAVTYTSSDIVQQFSPSVHVWDIEKMAKIKDHCVFEPKGDLLPTVNNLFLSHGMSENLAIIRNFEAFTGNSCRVRIFNMRKYEYNTFYVQIKSSVIWSAIAGDVVVVCELVNTLERDCVFHFYNILSYSCLLKTSTYHIYDPERISSSGSKFAFIDLNSEVTVFDIATQQKFISKLQPTRNRVKTLTLVNDQLLLLQSKYKGTNRIFENILVTSYEIWDFANKSKPIRLEQCFRSVRRTKFTFVGNCRVPPKLLTLVHPLYRPITIFVDSFW